MEQTIKFNGLEVTKILGINVNYSTAVNILKKAGDGWRFPTLAEFYEILQDKGSDALCEWFGIDKETISTTEIYVQPLNKKDDISAVSIDGQCLEANMRSNHMLQIAHVVLVRTDISERHYHFAQRYANEAGDRIKQLLKSHNVIGLDFDKYRGKCRIEDYDYIVQTDYDYDDNSLCGIYLKDDKLYVADSNGSDLYFDTYRCDLEVDLYDLVKNMFKQIDKGELELYEYPEDNI